MEAYSVFDEKFYDLIKDGISTIQLEKEEEEDTTSPSEPKIETTSPNLTALSCSYCKVTFSNSVHQREHYKLDWHRYNLKQNLLLKPPVTEEEFFERTDDVSSISGSDSEEEQNLDTLAGAQGKIFFKSNTGKVLGMYKCLVGNKKEDICNASALSSLKEYRKNPQWALFMLGGGHFAGAIFKNGEPFLHKTFHSYTVRAGQGGAQSARDNQGGTHAKSAGSSLRRYNEMTMTQHIKDIMDAWKMEMNNSSLIICRAAGPYNKTILFGGKTPLLDRNDPRIRNVPFSTRRATFTEVKRVFGLLSTVSLYDSVDVATKSFGSPDRSRRSRSKTSNVNRAKSRETIERELPAQVNIVTKRENEIRNTLVKSKRNNNKLEPQDDGSDDNQELTTEELTLNFQETLRPFEDTLTPEERQAKKSSRAKVKAKKQRERKQIQKRRENIFECAKTGELDNLKALLIEEMQENPLKSLDDFCTDSGDSLLHIAAKNCRENIILYLLESNSNLCLRNDKQETPYTCTKDKNVREFFKKYASENPDKYNYNKANIPLNTLTQEEVAEKRRQQKKFKREKEKEKKKEEHVKKLEQEEKNRFLRLSDREKMALAAERRILSQKGVVISRCFLCASDMSGKVPFEYMGNKFCTIECLKAHRMQRPVVLSTE